MEVGATLITLTSIIQILILLMMAIMWIQDKNNKDIKVVIISMVVQWTVTITQIRTKKFINLYKVTKFQSIVVIKVINSSICNKNLAHIKDKSNVISAI